jgi:hypothetical protein
MNGLGWGSRGAPSPGGGSAVGNYLRQGDGKLEGSRLDEERPGRTGRLGNVGGEVYS